MPSAVLIDDPQNLQQQFQAIRSDAEELLAGLSDAQFNWHPSAREWSIAEGVEHLGVTGRGVLAHLDQVISNAFARGLLGQGPFRYRMLERWVVRLAEAPWRKKFEASKGYVPSSARPYSEVAPSFFAVQEGFLTALLKAEGLDFAKTRVPNPTTTWFTLSLGPYLAMHAAHERRHLRQAWRVKEDPHFPSVDA
ncbi:MAG: DinB family protein [Gammaproteobacteria bacterium]